MSDDLNDDIDRIRNRDDYKVFLAADMRAHNVRRWHPLSRYVHPELHYQRVLRRVEYLEVAKGPLARISYMVSRLWLARLQVHTGISIPPGVFGRGLSIAHFGSIVVNDQARVGRYCRIHSATNIGVSGGGVPVLGDLVYVGPGAVLFGAISIGDGVLIGANSVVNSDVEAGVTVAGAPAKVVAHRDSSSSMPGWFPSADQLAN